MKLFTKRVLLFTAILFVAVTVNAQQNFNAGSVSGNFKLDAQTYLPDSLIGADTVNEKLLSNSYMNVIYTNGKFTAGVRFEGYFNTMLGYDKPYDGFGIGSRYATYAGDFLEVTAGNFYEQFGNGLVFRTYEDRDLGYDNAMDGMRVKIKPMSGITFTGIIGQQRVYWEKGEGLVRGADGNFSINDMFESLAASDHRITLGGSFVSKYQKDENPSYILPENVASGAGRLNYAVSGFSIATEYAYKSQDPSFDNGYIYKPGSTLLANANYSRKGFGVMAQYKWVDNMSFRSERDANLNNLLLNNLPAISKNHTYAFAAMYPYATQLNGEVGVQAEVFYKLKKKTLLGGKYGTSISVNFANVKDIDRQPLDNGDFLESGTDGYKTSFLSVGDEQLYRDINVEISRKFSKKLKGTFTYQNLYYNQAVLEGHLEDVNANTFVVDLTWKVKSKHALRIEAQSLTTKLEKNDAGDEYMQDFGNWAMLILEYTISPHWFFAVSDQYNYVSFDKEIAENTMLLNHAENELHRNHYYSVAMGYSQGATRIALSYGKQREGILCVGGVCRPVPAAYGALLTISHTF